MTLRAAMPDYLALAESFTSPNQFNRLHIDLSDILAPAEMARIADLAGLPRPGLAWIKRMRELSPELFLDPAPFTRQVIEDRIMFYEGHDRPLETSGLLVAFCGNARRLMMPVSVFLQLIDCRAWNVVVIRKDKGVSYFDGLPGTASDFPSLVRHLTTVCGAQRYRRVVSLGTSGGGSAAVLAATLAGAHRGISVGGSLPRAPIDTTPIRPGTHDLRFAFGAECDRDRASAISMMSVFGGRLHPVSQCETHNVLGTLLRRGEAAAFLHDLLE